MQQLSSKLAKLHKSIRKEHLASMMKKARYEMQRLEQEQTLRQIISLPPQSLTSEHFQTIVEMVNTDLTNAILHLGNLVIDRVVGCDVLERIEWKVGNNQKWTWLINCFSEIGFCTAEMFQLCVKRIICKRSNFSLENAIEVLQKSFKLNPNTLTSFRETELLLALSNHVYDQVDRISLVALTIFTSATSEDQGMPHYMYEVLGEKRIVSLLMHCFLKVSTIYRALACQVANNFLMSGIGLEDIRIRILDLALVEKEKVKLEISYYLKGLSETASQDIILGHIKNHKLIEILHKYSTICSVNPKYDRQISQNAATSLSTIFQRFMHSTEMQAVLQRDKGLMKKVEKMLDDSEAQTIYEEESRLFLN